MCESFNPFTVIFKKLGGTGLKDRKQKIKSSKTKKQDEG